MYGLRTHVEIDFQTLLGTGQEGFVWKTARNSAIKVFERQGNFDRELQCYKILQDLAINDINGFTVPELYGSDSELRVIEMSIVAAPFLLDFGKAYVGCPPEFSSEVMDDYNTEREELFEGNWDLVQSAIGRLRSYGIYYSDARPGNINCFGHPRAVSFE